MNSTKGNYILAILILVIGFSYFLIPQSIAFKKMDSFTKGFVVKKEGRRGKHASYISVEFSANGKIYRTNSNSSKKDVELINIGYPFIVKYEKNNPKNAEIIPFMNDSTYFNDTTLRQARIEEIERIRTNYKITIYGFDYYYRIIFTFIYDWKLYTGVRFVKNIKNIKVGDIYFVHVNEKTPYNSIINFNKPYNELETIKSLEEYSKKYSLEKSDSLPLR